MPLTKIQRSASSTRHRGYVLWMDGLAAVLVALLLVRFLASSTATLEPSVLDAQTLASDVSTTMLDAFGTQTATWAGSAGLTMDSGLSAFVQTVADQHSGACIQLYAGTPSVLVQSYGCASGATYRVSARSLRGVFTSDATVSTFEVHVSQ